MNRNQVADNGFTDIHCHILPGLDDGPATLQQSLEMARLAAAEGTSSIVATPHTKVSRYENPPAKVIEACNLLQAALLQEQIPLQILPGNEVHIHRTVVQTLRQAEAYTLANGRKHVLLELPFSGMFSAVDEVLDELLQSGLTPIIPHPERTDEICLNPGMVGKWVDKGVLTQITAGSLLGRFGRESQKCADFLIRQGYAHFIASDGHNVNHRKPVLREAYGVVSETYGAALSRQFQKNAQMVAR